APARLPEPSAAAEYVVEGRSLSKRYGALVAVEHVNVVVERGRIFGVLGPNGSGKSTTVRMLLGLTRPDRGDVRLFGRPLTENGPELLRRVGAVVETPAFIPYLSGRDNLRMLDRYAQRPVRGAVERALERVHLEGAAHRRFKEY